MTGVAVAFALPLIIKSHLLLSLEDCLLDALVAWHTERTAAHRLPLIDTQDCDKSVVNCQSTTDFKRWSLCGQGNARPGTLPAKAASTAQMARVLPEAALYRQLTHFHRQLDAAGAVASTPVANGAREAAEERLAPLKATLDAGTSPTRFAVVECVLKRLEREVLVQMPLGDSDA